jgi:hypothetical protein
LTLQVKYETLFVGGFMQITLLQVGPERYEIRNEGRLIAVLTTRSAAAAAMHLLCELQHDVTTHDPANDGPEVAIINRERNIMCEEFWT